MKYVFFLLSLVFFEVANSQDIKIEVYADPVKSDHSVESVRFKIYNLTLTDMWFYVNGLVDRMYILDQNGTQINPYLRVQPDPTGLPEYILIRGTEDLEIAYPLYDLSKRFRFEGNKEYYLYFEYENISRKKKTKIKTFIGKVIIEPLKF